MIFIFHSYAAKAYIENNMPGGNCLREILREMDEKNIYDILWAILDK